VKTELKGANSEAVQANTTDEVLVSAALTGSPEDFAPIIARYKDAVFGVSIARLRDFDDAEDITQQVFIEAFERLASLKDPNRLGAWLRTIAIHRSIKLRKREQRRVELNVAALPEGQVPTPVEELEQSELRDQVMAAIGRLSKVQRETVTLYYISGYSQQEVAAIQEVPLGTIKHRLHQARRKLKKDMVEMVEEVLKEGAPKDDFTQRVFDLLCAYPQGGRLWSREVMDQLKEIGSSGEAGFAKALALPHWQTRRAATHYLGAQFFYDGGALSVEKSVKLLKTALSDTNYKVRKDAMFALLGGLKVDIDYRREKLVPLVLPLLFDSSKEVRFYAAGGLSRPMLSPASMLDVPPRGDAPKRGGHYFRFVS
jgi:RNA polymerase sigma-70 factor (ECF subfamily)